MHKANTYSYRYATIDRLRPMIEAAQGDWLSPGERRAVSRFYDRTRRETWLAGRLLAKRLIAGGLSQFSGHHANSMVGENGTVPLSIPFQTNQSFTAGNEWKYKDIEISSAGARPRVSVNGRELNFSLSIAHTRQGVLVALSRLPGVLLGIDLVEPCAYRSGFADVWFTKAERRWLAKSNNSTGTVPIFAQQKWDCPLIMHRPRVMHAIVWAIKEAVYKALNAGEPFDPRSIETMPILETAPIRHGGCDCPPCDDNINVSSYNMCSFRYGGNSHCCHLTQWQTPQGEIALFAVVNHKGNSKRTVPLRPQGREEIIEIKVKK